MLRKCRHYRLRPVARRLPRQHAHRSVSPIYRWYKSHNLPNRVNGERVPLSPWKVYKWCAGIGFGVTLVSNFAVNVISHDPETNFINSPQLAATSLVAKSVWFGLWWPTIPVMMVLRPHNYFVLNNVVDKFEFETSIYQRKPEPINIVG